MIKTEGEDRKRVNVDENEQPPKKRTRLNEDELVGNSFQDRALFMQQVEKERNKIHEETGTRATSSISTTTVPLKSGDDSESPLLDMFSDSPTNETAVDDNAIKSSSSPTVNTLKIDQNVSGNFDDEEGYYRFSASEILNDRYQVLGCFGKGVFSTVLKVIDLETKEEFAVKMLRNNESMRKSGLKEIKLLKLISEKDPKDACFCVRMKDQFVYRNHLCIAFEPLYMNLREIINKFGKEQGKQVGISMEAVRLYSKQLFIALKHLQYCNILHADIKPDNILVNHSKTIAKLCDYGSASDASENSITPYLVSRFYRAPEIILGMMYSFPIDMWSVGCTLYELYTGRILFQSRDNNDQLKRIMEFKGKIPNKMLRKCVFRDTHFDQNGNFLFHDFDPVSGKRFIKTMAVNKSKDLRTDLLDATTNNDQATRKRVQQLYELIDKALALDPTKRLTLEQALAHPFYQPL